MAERSASVPSEARTSTLRSTVGEGQVVEVCTVADVNAVCAKIEPPSCLGFCGFPFCLRLKTAVEGCKLAVVALAVRAGRVSSDFGGLVGCPSGFDWI